MLPQPGVVTLNPSICQHFPAYQCSPCVISVDLHCLLQGGPGSLSGFPDEETEAYVKKLAQGPTVDGDEAVPGL